MKKAVIVGHIGRGVIQSITKELLANDIRVVVENVDSLDIEEERGIKRPLIYNGLPILNTLTTSDEEVIIKNKEHPFQKFIGTNKKSRNKFG